MERYLTFEVEDFIIDDFFIRWIVKRSKEDSLIWETWLENNPGQKFKVDQARNIILSIRFNSVPEISQSEIDLFIDQAKDKHSHLLKRLVYRKSNFRWLSIAACVLIGLSLTLILFKDKPHQNASHSQQTASTTKSKVVESISLIEKVNDGLYPVIIQISDGSTVILKPGSTLQYPRLFNSNQREVSLLGEAFFEVHRDSSKPFIVHAAEMTTKVLGTSFSVKAGKDDNDFRVVVNTGKVTVSTNSRLRNRSMKKSVTLMPNQQVTYYRDNSELIVADLSKPTVLSKEVALNMFNFKGTPVSQILNTLKDAYKVDIVYDEKAFATCRLTASLYNDQLVDKLTIICKAIDASFSIVNGKVVISGKGCLN